MALTPEVIKAIKQDKSVDVSDLLRFSYDRPLSVWLETKDSEYLSVDLPDYPSAYPTFDRVALIKLFAEKIQKVPANVVEFLHMLKAGEVVEHPRAVYRVSMGIGQEDLLCMWAGSETDEENWGLSIEVGGDRIYHNPRAADIDIPRVIRLIDDVVKLGVQTALRIAERKRELAERVAQRANEDLARWEAARGPL